MRVNTITEDLRQAANVPENAGPLMARAAAEIEHLRGGYTRILSLSRESIERGQAQKIASEYV